MEDSRKKGKHKQQESSSATHLTLPQRPLVGQPSSSSSAEPEFIQDAKRLKLTETQTQFPSPTHLSISAERQRTSDSSIPLPRLPPQHVQQTPPIASTEQTLAAQLRFMTPEARAVFKGQLIGKRSKQQSRAGLFWIRPGPSPLRPGPTPFEKVKKVVKRVMDYLNLSPQSQPLSAPDTADAAKPTILKVILMLDEYVEGIPRSASEEEMEGLLRAFQRRVGADDGEVSWYGSMKESSVAFWKSLADRFICETSSASGSNRQSSDSIKRRARIRAVRAKQSPQPEPARRRLLLPYQSTYLRPRPAHHQPDPSNTRMGPPEKRINGDTPYETVKKALTFLKSDLGLTTFPNPTYSAWKISPKSCSSVEEVILELDEYVNSIAETSSSDEMKALLMVFQRKLGLPAWPAFYNLLWFAPLDFLDHLSGNFISDCEW